MPLLKSSSRSRLFELKDDGKTLLVRSGMRVKPEEVDELVRTIDEQRAKHGDLNVIVERL